jgi:beta-glucanase (GH16 family)
MLNSLPVRLSLLISLAVFCFGFLAGAQQMKYVSSFLKEVDKAPGNHVYRLQINTLGTKEPLSLVSIQLKTRQKQHQEIYYSFSAYHNQLEESPFQRQLNSPISLKEGSNYLWIRSTRPINFKSLQLGQQQYQLTWSDEFEGDSINRNHWRFEHGFVRNNELQWYQEENATTSAGILTIEARKENKLNPLYSIGTKDWRQRRDSIHITSSSISTSGKQSWLYGRFEMRGRIDTVSGYWPAWWTLGVTKHWPSNGEIDIMEFYRGKILANIAVGTNLPSKALWYSETKAVNSFADPHWRDKFHIWRMDWDEEGVSLYVDDLLMNHQAQPVLYNRDSTGFYPFKQNHYMLLNLAIGGDNGGSIQHTVFPLKYEVDYVRVYQKMTGKYNSVRTYKPVWE